MPFTFPSYMYPPFFTLPHAFTPLPIFLSFYTSPPFLNSPHSFHHSSLPIPFNSLICTLPSSHFLMTLFHFHSFCLSTRLSLSSTLLIAFATQPSLAYTISFILLFLVFLTPILSFYSFLLPTYLSLSSTLPIPFCPFTTHPFLLYTISSIPPS